MFDGSIKPVEEIKIGDRIMGPDSSPRYVLSLHHGKDEMFRIVPNTGGAPFIVNGNHLLSVEQTSLPDSDWRSIYNSEWTVVSVLEWLAETKEFRHLHKLHRANAIEFSSDREAREIFDPYLLGLILGDGSIVKGSPSVCTDDIEVVDALGEIATKYGVSAKLIKQAAKRTPQYSLTGPRGRSNTVIDILRSLKLWGCRSGTKFIPHIFKTASRDDRLELLAGILDTDGYLSGKGFDYISKSKDLADDVAFIARSLGFCVSESQKIISSGDYAGNIYYRLNVWGDTNLIPTRIARKKADKRLQIKSPLLSGFVLEAAGVGEFFGFEVDVDNLYLTADFTVHHNSGKTKIAAQIVDGALRKGNRLAFVVSSISLIDQTLESFASEGIRGMGVIQANHEATDWAQPVQICSIQTLNKRGKFPAAQVVVYDECHSLHKTHKDWITHPEWTNIPFIGLSATPWARGLGKYFDSLLVVDTTQNLIEKGLLSKFKVFATGHPDLTGVKIVAGDYHEKQLSDAMQKGSLTADIVKTWQLRWGKDKTLIFGVDRAHAKSLQERFTESGISCAYQDALTTTLERAEIKRQFHNGEVRAISNVGTLTVGVDYDVRCLILARPTRSEILYTQIVGRALRTAPGKDFAILLDHSDTTQNLGLVTDIHHEHLSGGKTPEVERKYKKPLPKPCPKCACVLPRVAGVCPNCGEEIKPHVSGLVEIDGELVEITAAGYRADKKSRTNRYTATIEEKAKFLAGLKYIGIERGYKSGWSANQYRMKFQVWPDHSIQEIPPSPPTMEVKMWVRSSQIRWAISKKKDHHQSAS
jgi:superfamily II DNA or RNA helicase